MLALTLAMRLVFALPLLLLGCVDAAEESPDGIDDRGVDGKADGSQLSECETAKILELLNGGVSAEDLERAGVHARAAKELVAYRNGADAQPNTADDDKVDTIDEVDEVAYVGRTAFAQLAAAVAPRCAPDPFTDARDVTKPIIMFASGTQAPADYAYPEGGEFSLGGTEFWQKWSGGKNPTYSYDEGTNLGKLCMQASAIRFEEIMKAPPADLVKLKDTNWNGSFFNWNDDFSDATAWGTPSSARLWAWRTSLIKWISQTGKDGSCHLPTRVLVEKAAKTCLDTATRNMNGEIQGCQAQ